MGFITATDALELCLGLTVRLGDMTAGWTGTAGVLRGHRDQMSTFPRQLVLQLPSKLDPTLIKDRFVESRLRRDVCSRLRLRALRGCRHIRHLQVLDAHERVVFC